VTTAPAATSAVLPSRPSWVPAIIAAICRSPISPCARTLSSSGVSIGPGTSVFAVMPNRAFSLAMDLLKPTAAALVAAYTALPLEPIRPASEDTVTIRP